MKNPYLVGERIYLRPFDVEEDAPIVLHWFNDPEVRLYLRRYMPMTLTEEKQFLESSAGSTTNFAVGIAVKESNQLIGATGLHDIHPRHRHAQFGITIGDKTYWNQGIGSEATRLVIRHGFDTLNLNRVWLHVYEFNERAMRVYEKLGFKVEGKLRQDYFHDGRYWDTIVMGILRDESRRSG